MVDQVREEVNMASNRELRADVASVLLAKIKEAAEDFGTPDHLAALSQAYATVVGAMPKDSGRVL